MGDSSQRQLEQSEFGLSQLLRETFDLREGSVGDLLNQLLHAARLHLGMEVSFISRFHEKHRVFRCVDQDQSVNLLRVGQSDPLDKSYCKKVVDGVLPELIHDAQKVPAAREIGATEALGIGAHVSVPIRFPDGTVYGTFCLFSFHADHSLNERDLALIKVFSNIAAHLIEEEFRKTGDLEIKAHRIRSVLAKNEISMVWQPILAIPSRRVVGAEALARFSAAPHRGPAEWFAEAAEVGLAQELEVRALESGLELLDHLPPERFITGNISASSFLQPDVQSLLAGMPLHRIVLEVTEHDVVEDYASLDLALKPLREQGMRVAVDDAGAGYASLRHVLQLKPDIIKLDMSLVRDIDTDVTRRSLAACLLRFASEINSEIIAEGVETQQELDTLTELGVGMVQGFLLYKPLSRDDILPILL